MTSSFLNFNTTDGSWDYQPLLVAFILLFPYAGVVLTAHSWWYKEFEATMEAEERDGRQQENPPESIALFHPQNTISTANDAARKAKAIQQTLDMKVCLSVCLFVCHVCV